MSAKQKPDLAAALADVSGSSRRRSAPLRATPSPAAMGAKRPEPEPVTGEAAAPSY